MKGKSLKGEKKAHTEDQHKDYWQAEIQEDCQTDNWVKADRWGG